MVHGSKLEKRVTVDKEPVNYEQMANIKKSYEP